VKPSPRKSGILVSLSLLVATIAAVAYIMTLPIWQIKEVVINGARMLSDNEIRALAAVPLSENLFTHDFSRTRNNLGRITPIKSFRIYRIPPATVLISIRERVPIAAVVFSNRSILIDREGYILNRNPNLTLNIPNRAELPIVTGIDPQALQSDRVDGRVAGVISDIILKLSRHLESSKMQLELGGLEDVSFLLDDLLRARVGSKDDIRKKMEVFGALLPQISGRWDQVEYVDVRYPDNPVIKYR